MRHLKKTAKLGRTGQHRNAMLANMVCSLIKHKRITTTLAKAKAARPVAEKIATLGKAGTVNARRLVTARLRAHGTSEQLTKEQRAKWNKSEDVVRILFDEIAPALKARQGGYTRIIRLHERQGDACQLAILEWVDSPVAAEAATEAKPAEEAKPAPEKAGEKTEEKAAAKA
jgi:large subunit ribosomal protein L17